MATEGKTATPASAPPADLTETGKLEITDARTKKAYSIPITQGGVEGDTVIRATDSRYVYVLNEDTTSSDWGFRRMVAFLDATPRIAALGPRLVYPDGSRQRSACGARSCTQCRSGGRHRVGDECQATLPRRCAGTQRRRPGR